MTKIDSENTISLVTGGGGGLGGTIAHTLAASGDHVCVVDVNPDSAERVAGEIRSAGYSASAHICDITNRAEVEALAASVQAEIGVVDSLINLAGVSRNASLLKIDDSDFDLVLATHLKSTLNTMRAFVPGMKEQRYGRIVNTSSIAAGGSPAGGSYGAAKGAIEGLSRSAALELARHGITVNCIAPGLIDAGMALKTPDSFREPLVARIPMGRFGAASEIAACVRFLASADCSYVTGQTLLACGGLSLAVLS
ncbi:SDR family NAD(P)-dependent oxidoreductase [Rhodococcus sp. WY5]|jgi:3-oxoacyl-[acyl-carrier protein] reductase|uniref:SDR family NAD(P)-dependent oxidoreductase n=1 Tax=Rhodococcus sp. WY5 TaxID=2708349 RepID=UPI001BDF2B2D|nr:SDR family NAD(P)-dependent oxidoreductase [Rhodococcus sp. WY5]